MSSRRQRPARRTYLGLAVRNELLRLRLAHARRRRAEAEQLRNRYQQWYLSGLHLIAGLEAQVAYAEDRLKRLERQADKDAPVVSGWKVDLDAALEANAVLTARVAELEELLAPATARRQLLPSPPEVRIAVHQRLAAAAPDPAGLPAAPVPLWEKRNAS